LLPLDPVRISAMLELPPPPPDSRDLHLAPWVEGTAVRDAAVLVPMVQRDRSVNLLFTQRTEHLAAHAGQISFPGGRVESHDANRVDTALRETEEEIGLARRHVRVLGALPEYFLPTGFRITPVVGWIEAPFATRADPYEVADIFEVPLVHFLDAERHRHYVAIPYEGRYIWGATAGMLLSMAHVLSPRADPRGA
jgi:8-oxo-dGTP pyrophosphatase MutT (NUDIX family)